MRTVDLAELREEMIQDHLAARGIKDETVLNAFREVPREAFIPDEMVEFAYADTPLPIAEEQTISQPYIVAVMTEQLELSKKDRVLEIGTGSGYAAAILSRVASEVYTIERHRTLAETAEQRLHELGYYNIYVLHGDGTLGWEEHAPYDAIVVAAGGPEVPEPLKRQLTIGGRLVIPVGDSLRTQTLVRVRRTGPNHYETEDLGGVRFVPLIGQAGWKSEQEVEIQPRGAAAQPMPLPELIARSLESIGSIDQVSLENLLNRIGDARVVLLGESTHGTAEFYDMRARITRELIENYGFTIVAVEADWPDAAHINHYIQATEVKPGSEQPFMRFPTWMWANQQVRKFVDGLKLHNGGLLDPTRRVGFYGLDLYSLYTSIESVLKYLREVDPETARVAMKRYGCLTPWEKDPAAYGAATLTGRYKKCEEEVAAILKDLMQKRLEYASRDGRHYFNAMQNARLIQKAEEYYRIMYYGANESWNLRDSHMFETLLSLLEFTGENSRAVVWEHNSHIGNAAATEMGRRGEHNVGQLCKEKFGERCYAIGFSTDHGTVAAASDWDEPMEIKTIRPSHPDSYEYQCHESGSGAFMLPLSDPSRREVRERLMKPRLERAIGVIYRPETEMMSHYFQACLPQQFDEFIWFDETHAVTPLRGKTDTGSVETFPFGV